MNTKYLMRLMKPRNLEGLKTYCAYWLGKFVTPHEKNKEITIITAHYLVDGVRYVFRDKLHNQHYEVVIKEVK
jgi:hypothetical protein